MSDVLPACPGKKILRAAEAAAWSDGYAFLEEARAQANALLASRQDDIAAARAAGFEAGRLEGERQAAALLARAGADLDRYLEGLDARLAELSLSVVRKLVGTFDDAALAAAFAREALGAFRDETRVVLRVAPHLVPEVEALLAERGDARPPVRVDADPAIGAGRCVLASPAATMEIGLDAQLDALRAAFAADGTR